MNRVTLLSSALVLGLACAPAARAATRPAAQPGGAASARRRVLIWDFKSELGLTDAQIQSIRSAASSGSADSTRLAQQVRRDEDALRVLVANDAPLAQERVVIEHIAAATVEARMVDLARAKSVLAVLTPGQRAKWHDLQAARRPAAQGAHAAH